MVDVRDGRGANSRPPQRSASGSTRMKAKKADAPAFRCVECGWESLRWVGRCGECQTWGTVDEIGAPPPGALTAGPVSRPATPISQVPADDTSRRSTTISELDRVLGGGLVSGAVILVTGEPGIGKSTLLLEMAAREARSGRRVLYVSGEESAGQVRMRADRMGAVDESVYLANEVDLAATLSHIDAVDPDLLIVDSVQTISTGAADGMPGGVAQVRAVAAALTQTAKSRNMATVLVGHVTKDGNIAGPRTLEHIVDVVIHFEGERHAPLRLLRAVKNRFGAVDDVGCFELVESGIVELPDPSGLFVSHRAEAAVGTAITVALEGRRPLVTEIQALVDGEEGKGRRTTSGLDSNRVAMVAAVVRAHSSARLASGDLYAASLGGVRIGEPAADLAIALAIASAGNGQPLPPGVVAVGEVGLAGDIRAVPGVPRRIREAERMGLRIAIIPKATAADVGSTSLELIPVSTLRQAVAAVVPPAARGKATGTG